MISLRAGVLLVLGSLAVDAPPALRVIRTTPLPEAGPTATITVTFDRPVAGSLDQTVDPRGLLIIDPDIAGTTEWRDPVTLRFRASSPLEPGATYQVTVKPTFRALDGSQLGEAHRFGFRITGPRILAGVPVGPDEAPRFLRPDEAITLAVSSAARADVIERMLSIELSGRCGRSGPVRLQVVRQGGIPAEAPWRLREAGGWDRDRTADSLRRLVTVKPAIPIPLGCAGALVAPTYLDAEHPGPFRRYPFSTYGAFRLNTVGCGRERVCPTGPVELTFSTPVRGAEVLRRVKLLPVTKFTVSDTSDVRDRWTLWADLKPRTGYLVEVDVGITDAFGQRLVGNRRGTAVTTGFAPEISYQSGRLTIERNGPRTLPVTYVNVDTLEVVVAAVPESLEAKLLSRSWYSWNEDWAALEAMASRRRVPVASVRDRPGVYGVPFPAPEANAPGTATLYAVKVTNRQIPRPTLETGERSEDDSQPIALIQITDLGVHAKIGREEGSVWVTGASDGKARPGAAVVIRDRERRVLARGVTDAAGLFRATGLKRPAALESPTDESYEDESFEGYVEARLGGDRALVGINQYDPDLSPWQFNVSSAGGADRYPLAAAVFTERGIYRPGDSVFAKAIVRAGNLGDLRVPAPADSVRLLFQDRDEGTLLEHVAVLSAFGTLNHGLVLPNDAPLGDYQVTVAMRRDGGWQEVGRAGYRVAEYRAPEFLVDVIADTATRKNGDSLRATVGARYLFGAPMAGARVSWSVRQTAIEPWDLTVPNTEGYFLANRGWWWEEWSNRSRTSVAEARADSLDGAGQLVVDAPLVLANPSLPARVSVDAVVTDVNRQSVFGSSGVVVHPTDFYVGAKPVGPTYFWQAGQAQPIDLIAVEPGGRRVPNVAVNGMLIRREWHQVRRETDGYSQLVGEWVQDTVDRCQVRTGAGAGCRLTPNKPGSYVVAFGAADGAGRAVSTSFYRWVLGPGWVPWADESQFKMDVVPDRSRYAVGDTATVLFASPFTAAEAWVTVEREGLIEQRRLTIADGATSLKLPVSEAWAPNAFVSIVVTRGRSAKPGPLDDPGRPTIRVGYAEVRVTPEKKRLSVTLVTDQREYRPGDEAAITASVQDAGHGAVSEVTLWAVDEGVLSLTGYRTPDPIDLLYQPRGLGLRLGSNLTTVAPQVAAGDKGRNPGGGGGDGMAEVLRSRFKTTAFFLGSVITDAGGRAVARVKLPDNLTTFRVMAVAVTAGDRYGGGQLPLLVTRPLLARAALPRFVRAGDRLTAGVVVNHRTGGTPNVQVKAQATGVSIQGKSRRSATLEAGRGREVRFDFTAKAADSATFRFDVTGAGDRDAVRLAIPVRPAFRSRVTTVSGVVTDLARVTLDVSPDADPARSRVALTLGTTPLALLKGYADDLRVYPYFCSEQVSSVALPLIALYRARKQAGPAAGDTLKLRRQVEQSIAMLVRRQRSDGAIGLWSATDWSSAWMSANAGAVLVEARAAGLAVADTVLAGIAGYLTSSLERQENMILSVGLRDSEVRANLTERVAVTEFLSRFGRRNRSLENELIRRLGQMAPDDRMQFAVTLVRAGDMSTARRIMEPLWAAVKVEGRAASIPDSLASRFYFPSAVRTPAFLLWSTLAVDPAHALLAPLLESVVTRGRARAPGQWWNTQDYAAAVRAVDAWQRRFPSEDGRPLEIRVAGKTVLSAAASAAFGESSLPLAAIARGKSGPITLDIVAAGAGGPAFYYVTMTEYPRAVPVNPEDRGFQVERWYEDYRTGKPIVAATEGDLVRVRLRVTVPNERSFVVLDDPLPAGLEAIDLSLKTVGGLGGPGQTEVAEGEGQDGEASAPMWTFGSWDSGWWSPFDHRELRDDRVVYAARLLWQGSYTATYLARATTPGIFVRPQAHAEEMYNPAVFGRSDGGQFLIRPRAP